MEFNTNGPLYQWNLGRTLEVTSDEYISEIQFANCSTILSVELERLEGVVVAKIPNILLQTSGELTVYVETSGSDEELRTVARRVLKVLPRARPANYVYEETEVLTYKALEDKVAKAVSYEYLEDKPSVDGKELVGDMTLDELNIASKDYVEQEIAKFDFIKIVTELPEVGLPNRIYFVPKSNTSDNDLFDEYAWVNEQWEFYGTKQIEVDLTDYVKKTDKATPTIAGLVRVLAGDYGLKMYNDILQIYKATNTDIDNKLSDFRPITPSILDYAVMKALSDSKLEWTEEQKASALALLGAIAKPTNPTTPTVVTMDANGNISTVRYTASAIAYTVVQRTANGTLITAKPTNDNEATNKAYVDELVGDVQSIITELHSYAETLKGGA